MCSFTYVYIWKEYYRERSENQQTSKSSLNTYMLRLKTYIHNCVCFFYNQFSRGKKKQTSLRLCSHGPYTLTHTPQNNGRTVYGCSSVFGYKSSVRIFFYLTIKPMQVSSDAFHCWKVCSSVWYSCSHLNGGTVGSVETDPITMQI